MVYANELIMLILGAGVLYLTILNQQKIRRIYAWKLLMLAFYYMMAGSVFTILEGFFMEQFINILEHISYSTSAVIMALWCRQFAGNKLEDDRK
jgi:hypothetical protein